MATFISSTTLNRKGWARKQSDELTTTEGTLRVSKPFRTKTSRKPRALVTFTPRKSVFDINNETSGVNEFRVSLQFVTVDVVFNRTQGFYSLFWVSIFLWAVRTYITGIETSGSPLNFAFATMFSQDAITLAISDFFLILSTGLCVPFAWAISKGYIRYYWTGLVLQHILQTTILLTTIIWTFNRFVDC
jgi:sterol O-acyltransferase